MKQSIINTLEMIHFQVNLILCRFLIEMSCRRLLISVWNTIRSVLPMKCINGSCMEKRGNIFTSVGLWDWYIIDRFNWRYHNIIMLVFISRAFLCSLQFTSFLRTTKNNRKCNQFCMQQCLYSWTLWDLYTCTYMCIWYIVYWQLEATEAY